MGNGEPVRKPISCALNTWVNSAELVFSVRIEGVFSWHCETCDGVKLLIIAFDCQCCKALNLYKLILTQV